MLVGFFPYLCFPIYNSKLFICSLKLCVSWIEVVGENMEGGQLFAGGFFLILLSL